MNVPLYRLRVCIVFLTLASLPEIVRSDSSGALRLTGRVDHIDRLAREPMIARHPNGTVFVTGYGSQVSGTDWTAPPHLWRSNDNGTTWSSVDVGTSEGGAQGNSDVDLTIGPNGTVYLISMGFNRTTGKGTQISVGVSHDVGRSWHWQRLSETTLDDRPWIRATPDGVVHAIWNDGSGVCHAVSSDKGSTWSEQPRIHNKGGSSHLAIGPEGELAVRISPVSGSGNQFDAGVDLVAVSVDDGKTWSKHQAPGDLQWGSGPDALPRWVEPLAWGSNGTLFSLWSEGSTVKLGWSKSLGASWDESNISQEAGQAFFPYLISNDSGELAATWFVSHRDSLSARLAYMKPNLEKPALNLYVAEPFSPSAWLENTPTAVPTPAGEYVPVLFLDGHELAVVSPVQDSHQNRFGFTWWQFQHTVAE